MAKQKPDPGPKNETALTKGERLSTLLEIGKLLISEIDLDNLLKLIVQKTTEVHGPPPFVGLPGLMGGDAVRGVFSCYLILDTATGEKVTLFKPL